MSLSAPPQQVRRALWAMMCGNVVIGTGVMVVPGTLNDIAASLDVSAGVAGQIITASGLLMCVGAPLMALLVSRLDRAHLLPLSLLWYGLTHLLCVLATSFSELLWLRLLAVVAPALYTPQAAAVVAQLVPPAERGRAMSTVFLGWSVASVLGMPLSAWLGGHWGWRSAFALVGVLGLLNAWWLWRVLPGPIHPPAVSLKAWRQMFMHKTLMSCVMITLIAASAQFTLFAYFAPYLQQHLAVSPLGLALFFAVSGSLGFAGMLLTARHIDRVGPARIVTLALYAFMFSLAVWPLADRVWLAMLLLAPWSLMGFAWNSAQQTRLAGIDTAVSSVSVSLNTSAIYLGQAIGAGLGGWLIVHDQMTHLSWFALPIMAVAWGVNHRLRRGYGV